MKGRIEIDTLYWIIFGVIVLLVSVFLLYTFVTKNSNTTKQTDCSKQLKLYCVQKYSVGIEGDKNALKTACPDLPSVTSPTFNTEVENKCTSQGLK